MGGWKHVSTHKVMPQDRTVLFNSCISHKFDLPFLHYILESNFYNSSIVNASSSSSSYESESADISVSPSNISIIENEDESKLKSKLTNLITLDYISVTYSSQILIFLSNI